MSIITTFSFHDLDEDKMDEYMALSNKIDTKLGEKFVKKIPLRAAMAFITGGASLIFATARQVYQVNKKSQAIDAVKAFVDNQRKLHCCKYVDWNTFPEAHIIVGGNPMNPSGKPTTCPLCKQHEMRRFVADSNREIMSCSHCNRIVSVKVNRATGRSQEVLIPGIFAAAIPFTGGIEHLGELALDMSDLIADVAGLALDVLA